MSDVKMFPAPQDVKFLLCEDFRREDTGKLLIVGLFPGDTVVVGNPKADQHLASLATVPQLCFIFIMRNGKGTFTSRVVIDLPDGRHVLQEEIGTIELRGDNTATAFVSLRTFPVRAFGEHRVTFYLDQTPYVYTCEIRKGAGVAAKPQRSQAKGRRKKPALATKS